MKTKVSEYLVIFVLSLIIAPLLIFLIVHFGARCVRGGSKKKQRLQEKDSFYIFRLARLERVHLQEPVKARESGGTKEFETQIKNRSLESYPGDQIESNAKPQLRAHKKHLTALIDPGSTVEHSSREQSDQQAFSAWNSIENTLDNGTVPNTMEKIIKDRNEYYA